MWLSIKESLYWVFYPIIVLKALYVMARHGRELKRRMSADELEAIENSGFRFMLFYMEWRINVFRYLLYAPAYGILTKFQELHDNPDLKDPLFPLDRHAVGLCCFAVERSFEALVQNYENLKKRALAAEHLNLWVVDMHVIILLDDIAGSVDDDYNRALKHYMLYFKERWKT